MELLSILQFLQGNREVLNFVETQEWQLCIYLVRANTLEKLESGLVVEQNLVGLGVNNHYTVVLQAKELAQLGLLPGSHVVLNHHRNEGSLCQVGVNAKKEY